MSLRVLSPGVCSLVVDAGRPWARPLGVAVGGAADAESLAIGNALLGNPPHAPSLEIALVGPTLVAESDVAFVVAGAAFPLWIDGEPHAVHESHSLRAGQTLRIGPCASGCRGYVCVAGGFHGRVVLGSCSALAPLVAGDVLNCESSHGPRRRLDRPTSWLVGPIRCIPGPQADWFDQAFFETEYTVSAASNRMGVRLEGPAIPRPVREMVSEPVSPGAVQITNDGRPIVLGVDGQTIGGYPKVAHVISADLDRLGQLRPGDRCRFVCVAEDAAEQLGRAHRERIAHEVRRIHAGLQ